VTEQDQSRLVSGTAMVVIVLGVLAVTMLSLWAIIAAFSGIVKVLSP